MNKLPIVIATSIVRTSGLNEPHGFLYVVDLKTKKVTRTIEWNDPEIDFAGRGRQQGLRGIAFYNDKIYIGTGFKILEFSKDFDLLASYQNQYLNDIHEMIVVENRLLVISSGYDAVIYFDLNTKLFTKAYAVDVKDFSFKKNLFYRFFNKYAPYWLSFNKSIENYPLYVFDPETPNQIKGTSFKPHRIHFNTVSMSKSGMCVSGTLSNYQFLITKEEISKYATIHSFEPTPKLFANLKHKYGNFDHVFLRNITLANDNKEIDCFQSEPSPTNSCLEPDASLYKDFKLKIAETLDNSTNIKVNGLKLDTWYKENTDGQIIDIVKTDTQGFEYNVIKGGIDSLKENVKLLYFEIQHHDLYKKAIPFYKIYELLYDIGFYYYCHLFYNKRKKYQEIENDVLFVNSKFLKSYDLSCNIKILL